ncbi:MAG TPA: glycosyltransferase family 2 protein [Gaiellales bacterium]
MAATPDRARAAPAHHQLYVPRRERVLATMVLGFAWAGLSAAIDRAWIGDLAAAVTLPVAIAVVAGIAIVPGYLNAQLLASVLLDRPKRLPASPPCEPGVTVLVAAYNEEAAIEQTLAAVLAQDYAGPLRVLVIDDGSADGTCAAVERMCAADGRVGLVRADHGGKAAALNLGLACATTPLVATVDADTLLVPSALRRIVNRLLVDPDGTVAVAGSVLVRNSRGGLVARMQEWDYQLGITAVKRQQALLGATLVAQGAFSAYRTQEMRLAGGWPDRIGEDIVATWALIEHGGRVAFEPTAVAFTSVPTSLRRFMIQRQRWARGMIEGLNTHGASLLRRRGLWVHSVVADAIFPFLDLTYTLAVPAGIVLAAFGNFAIVGPLTLAVLPLNLAMCGVLLARERGVFAELGLHVRRNRRGFLAYFLLYQLIQSPISVSGYILELRGARRVW